MHVANLREKPESQVPLQRAEQEYWNSYDEQTQPSLCLFGPLDGAHCGYPPRVYVQLGAVSGCSRFASTLGLGSFTMFLSCRLIQSSTGKL